jgi:AcrR family transcriptional regulator
MEEILPRSKAAQRAATSAALVAVARACFAQQGYSQTAMEEIVQRAGVTRGALYHNFGGKEGLFAAVVREVQRSIAERVELAAQEQGDPWAQLLAGCRAFLAASLEPEVQQIILLDGPAVLGWEAWRQIDLEYSFRLLLEGLQTLARAGLLATPSVEGLAYMLSGAMNEAALWIARAPVPEEALESAMGTLSQLVASFQLRA